MDPNIDPFAPPQQFMAPPPPPAHQNYVNPPPMPPQFPLSPNTWSSGQASVGNNINAAPPLDWSSFSNMLNSPAALPAAAANDIGQPMPAAAASAGSSSSYNSGSAPEQEFEQEGGSGGSGGTGGQTYNPPPAFGVQPSSYYGSQPTSLLDAYYRVPRNHGPAYSTNNNNNGFFGGMFGDGDGDDDDDDDDDGDDDDGDDDHTKLVDKDDIDVEE
ncbi:hypothetical protein ElyMa_004738600 [Elysia marginata]|uniref:Uncharacterized protein n=1 Tax=Elysia marginata TaxID=1093978 RepID=A0AAV4IFA0_9GAST|nr:hypothetical protein ElyMa_004738600 [Elysia marginata]